MKVLVIDGQGGKLGKLIIEKLKERLPTCEVIAIGTNSIATATMLKAGADGGATGENPVVVAAPTADVIVGPVGIAVANSLLGEVTPAMAVAVGTSNAQKILIPINKCKSYVVLAQSMPLPDYISAAVNHVVDIDSGRFSL